MAKDSYWFKHDSTAGRGTRMRKMTFIYGHWGKGIYWDVIEILREQDGYCFEKDGVSLNMLCDIIGCKDPLKFNNWFNDCIRLNLLQLDDKMFFSEVLIENMTGWETSKANGSKGGRPPKPKRNQDNNQSHNLNETIREDKSILEEKRIDNIKTNLIDSFFNDLPNSQALETICRNCKINKDVALNFIPEFKLKVNLEYKDFNKFVEHFRNCLLLHVKNQVPTNNLNKPKLLN